MKSRNIYKHINYVKKRKNIYKNFLKSHELNKKTFNYASTVDKKNILLKNMNFLIRLSNQQEDDFIDHMNILRLLSTELYYLSSNSLDVDSIIQVEERIDDILNKLNLVTFNENLELEATKGLSFTLNEFDSFFNYHKVYSIIANVFAAPFIRSNNYYFYYEYGYNLAMFLNLHYFANEYLIYENPSVFFAKLNAQQNMIEAIQKITPEYFNIFIIKTNKWIKKINFKKVKKEIEVTN